MHSGSSSPSPNSARCSGKSRRNQSSVRSDPAAVSWSDYSMSRPCRLDIASMVRLTSPSRPVPWAAELFGHGLVEVEAESVRCNHEEHATPLTVFLFDSFVPDVEPRHHDPLLGAMDVRHLNRCAVLRRVAAGERKSDLDAVSLED